MHQESSETLSTVTVTVTALQIRQVRLGGVKSDLPEVTELGLDFKPEMFDTQPVRISWQIF